nr:hypothetical protein [Tanacetum cinerariifolium]
DTTMPFRSTSTTRRRLKKPFTFFASTHVSENIPAGASIPTAATTIPAGDAVTEENMNERLGMVLLLPAVSPAHIAASVPAKTVVHTAESHVDDPLTASEHVSTKPTVDAPTPSSSRSHTTMPFRSTSTTRRRLKKPFTSFASAHVSENIPAGASIPNAATTIPAGSSVDAAVHSLDDEDALDFWHNQDSWRICSWRLYPRAQVHVLETVDGWIIHMFVDVSYPLTVGTLERMLKHGLEVPKLLVGGDLTMAEQLVTKNWMVFTFHVPFWNEKWLVQGGTALGKDKSNPLIVGSLLKTTWSSIHHLLIDEVLTSPEQTATSKDISNPFMAVMVYQKPLGYSSSPMIHVPRAELVFNPPGWSPYSCWFLVASVWLVATGFVLFMLLE